MPVTSWVVIPRNILRALWAHLHLVLAIGLSLAWTAFFLWTGQQLNPDLGVYLHAAVQLHTGAGLEVPPEWPPAYPILIHLAMALGHFPDVAATLVGGVALAVMLVAAGTLARDATRAAGVPAVLVLALFGTFSIFQTFRGAWSGGPFLAFLVLHVLCVSRHARDGRWSQLIWAGVWAAAAAATRYVGLSVLAAFGLYIACVAWWTPGAARRRSGALLVGLASGLPSLLYVIRNAVKFGEPFGARHEGQGDLIESLAAIGRVSTSCANRFELCLVALALVVWVWAYRRQALQAYRVRALTYLGVCLAGYVALLAWATSKVSVDPVSARMVAPIHALVALVLVLVLTAPRREAWRGYWRQRAPWVGQWVTRGVWLLVAAAVVSHALRLSLLVNGAVRDYAGAGLHIREGFALSSTAAGLDRWFAARLAEADTVSVAVVGWSARRPDRARTLLYRRSALRRTALAGSRYHVVGADDVTVSFQSGGAIQFLCLPRLRSDAELVGALRGWLDKGSIETLWLIAHVDERRGIAEDPTVLGVAVRGQTSLPPYRIYELGRSVDKQIVR